MTVATATVLAPATVGNVGPGFDVLGLCVGGAGDRVTVELHDGADEVAEITGRDADLLPKAVSDNAAALAARGMLDLLGVRRGARLRLHKGLPLSGGMGGSAASSVGGALAAALAAGATVSHQQVMEAALVGESGVAGRHLDNIAPCVLGGLTLVLGIDPVDVIRIPVKAPWWVALVTPAVRVETKAARAILPATFERAGWVAQMARSAALVHAFSQGDAELCARALVDGYAEPRRAALIPHFAEVKAAALAAGALGCSISGAGPTVFALCRDEAGARRCAEAMARGFSGVASTAHVGPVSTQGAHRA